MLRKEHKIFDPADGFAPLTNLLEVTDSTVVRRGDQWWMCLAGQFKDREGIHLFSASLPKGALLARTGWKVTLDGNDGTKAALLAGQEQSSSWDLRGGRHCPSYVRGWDAQRGAWVERIYYAGSADNYWGPYKIGYLEWDGSRWIDQPAPAFLAEEDWEHGSVYEPNLVFDEGKWKMWYVAGSNQEGYIVQGYAESPDGRTNWTKRGIFFPPEEKIFDFCVIKGRRGFEAVFSRVWLGGSPAPAGTGLWWCEAEAPFSRISEWGRPVQIMTAEDCGWHSGPWKPSVQYDEADPKKMFVFFDGIYRKQENTEFPFVFTLGCLELERPR